MLVEENYVNQTEGYRIGNSGLYEPFTDKIGLLFRAYQRQFGKCISKVYIDNNGAKAIGWVFQKTVKYDDVNEYYLQETWVTLHEFEPVVTKAYHYHYL